MPLKRKFLPLPYWLTFFSPITFCLRTITRNAESLCARLIGTACPGLFGTAFFHPVGGESAPPHPKTGVFNKN